VRGDSDTSENIY